MTNADRMIAWSIIIIFVGEKIFPFYRFKGVDDGWCLEVTLDDELIDESRHEIF